MTDKNNFVIPRKRVSVTDCNGRVIVLQKPSFKEKMGFAVARGDKLSAYVMILTEPLQYIFSINGEETGVPTSDIELEWLGEKLDEAEDAMEVVSKAVNDEFLTAKKQDDALKNFSGMTKQPQDSGLLLTESPPI